MVALTADGASVIGTGRGGHPLTEPRDGPVGNLAHSLLMFKIKFTQDNLVPRYSATSCALLGRENALPGMRF